MEDYLEKVAEAAFKREYDQDENVVRSLPFFATALGVAVAIYALVFERLPAFEFRPVPLIIYFMLLLSGGAFLRTLWCLFQIVRVREFLIPADEVKLIAWAESVVAFHQRASLTLEAAKAATKTTVRKRVTQEYANSAVHNRVQNAEKLRYRAKGLTWLVVLITLASMTVAMLGAESALKSDPDERVERNAPGT